MPRVSASASKRGPAPPSDRSFAADWKAVHARAVGRREEACRGQVAGRRSGNGRLAVAAWARDSAQAAAQVWVRGPVAVPASVSVLALASSDRGALATGPQEHSAV